MFRGSPNRKLLIARKVVSLLVLGCLLLASMPIPLGTKVVQRVDSTPFPCMDCACGCATAEQCWTACCCFTPAERQSWAEQHGVTPPSYAVLSSPILHRLTSKPSAPKKLAAPAKPSAADCGSAACSKAHRAVCLTDRSRTCVACDTTFKHTTSGPTAPQYTAPATVLCDDTCDRQPEADAHEVTVLSVVALRCHGGSSQFSWLPWAIVQVDVTDVSAPEVIATPYVVFSDVAASSGTAPATPPPKC